MLARFVTAAGSALSGPSCVNAVPRSVPSASGLSLSAVSEAHHVAACVTPALLRPDGALLRARIPWDSPSAVYGRRVAPTWRVGAALHRGPRLLSSEALRPAWALAVGPAPGRPPVCVPRGGVSRPWPMHVAVSVVSRGKGTAARGVFSGAAPAATCGRVLPSLEMEEEGVSSPPPEVVTPGRVGWRPRTPPRAGS